MGDGLAGITTTRAWQALEGAGFALARYRGRHGTYRHPDGRRVTVPLYLRRIVPEAVLRAILADAGLDETEFLELLPEAGRR